MQIGHAMTLALARSFLAALADSAGTVQGSSAYEQVLLELDRIHNDDVPAIGGVELLSSADLLYAGATSAIEDLAGHGVDELHLELILAMLDDARALDRC